MRSTSRSRRGTGSQSATSVKTPPSSLDARDEHPIQRLLASRYGPWIPWGILATSLVLAATSALRTSVTVDEYAFLPSGLAILKDGAFQIESGTAPLPRYAAALPLWLTGSGHLDLRPMGDQRSVWLLGRVFLEQNLVNYHVLFLMARLVSLAVFALTCWLAGRFARSLYGNPGGLIALTAAAFSPNLLAHGRLVTTDIHLAAAMIGTIWALDAWLRQPNSKSAALLGSAIGLATLSKFTGVLLFGAIPAVVVTMACLTRFQLLAPDKHISWSRRTWISLACALAVAVIVIHLGYGGNRPLTALRDFEFQSPLFQRLQRLFPGGLPVPLPYYFVEGFDSQLHETGYVAYLMGQFNQSGFWHYYLVAFLVKSAPAGLLLVVVAAVLRPRLMLREVPMLMIALGLGAFLSVVGHKNIGVRYLLFVIPIATVWMGRIGTSQLWTRPRGKTWMTGGLLAAAASLLATNGLIWPDYLAYFNAFSGGPDRGHYYLLDSNLDWGQDLLTLQEYMDRQKIDAIELAYWGRVPPELYRIRYDHFLPEPSGDDPETLERFHMELQPLPKPRHRYVVISANLLWGRMYFVNGTGFHLPPAWQELYAEFRERPPVTILGHTLYVFDTQTAE